MEKINDNQNGKIKNDIEVLKIDVSNLYSRLKKRVIQTNISSDGTVSKTILPNVFYNFTGELTSLSITLGTQTDGVLNEFMFSFLTSANVPSLSIANVNWFGGTPTLVASKTYIVKIINNVATIIYA